MNKTKADLVETIRRCAGCTEFEAAHTLDRLIKEIEATITAGGDVIIRGFGTFKRKTTAARPARNPRTGEAFEVPAGYRVLFRPGSKFKARLADAAASDRMRKAAE